MQNLTGAAPLGRLPSPPQITAYIKAQKEKALDSMRGFKPATALLIFCSSMQHLYRTASCQLNYIHMSAIITALGHVWPAAQRHPSWQNQPQARHSAEALYDQSLKQLQPMLQDMGARQISNILWSSAKLGFNPDDFVPGMVHTLADRFLQLMHDANMSQCPNAQNAANFVWALATMHHAAATDQLLGSVCTYFASLLQHSDARQRPTSQAVANVMWALAVKKHTLKDGRLLDDFFMYMHELLQSQGQRARPKAQEVSIMLWALAELKHTLKDGRLRDDFCMYMHSLLQHPDAWQRPTSQAVSNFMWALAEVKHSPKDGWILDDFCMYMHGLLQSQDQRARLNAQDVANMLWALAELKHAPPNEVASALLDHLIALCQTPGLQLKSQEISNFSLHVLNSGLYSAWSLAVMGSLDISMFDAILYQLTKKHNQLLGEAGTRGTSAQLTVEAAHQLHQGSEWLKPPQGSHQMEAWSSSHSRLQEVAPKPHRLPKSFPGQAKLCDALATQSLPYKAQVPFGPYNADAVLSIHDSSAAQVILVLVRPDAYLTNTPSR
ncbi:hypothetical protein MMC16_007853 [Acarospora aff. strigata]|nr:hypothetical protein [Acarospora aff. strigata]